MKNNLKERIDNGVKFVKDHKKEILIGSGTVLAAVVVGRKVGNIKTEFVSKVTGIQMMNVGIEAVCRQQNLNFEDVANDELANIIDSILEDEELMKKHSAEIMVQLMDKKLDFIEKKMK